MSLKPEKYYERASHIDVCDDVLAEGFSHLLLDVDNTILTRDTHTVPLDVQAWLKGVRESGVHVCLLSNNWHGGVYELARVLRLPLVAKAVKPLPPAFLKARKLIGGSRENTLVVGDQLMTDVVGAHMLGMRAYLLCPLVSHDLKHTLALRHVERVILGGMEPQAPSKG